MFSVNNFIYFMVISQAEYTQDEKFILNQEKTT